MKTIFSTWIFLLCAQSSYAAENLILISVDGLRWQETFTGADKDLIENKDFVKDSEKLKQDLWRNSAEERRKTLMPFLWDTIIPNGVIIGNRATGSLMDVANPWYFSYPGYNEMLTGAADPEINSNKKIANKNVTFLEWANNQSQYKGKVAAFGSWDVFPYILNTERSQLPVNAGFMPAEGKTLTAKENFLNELQTEVPSPWDNVRLDAFTYGFAAEYIKREQPSIIYISLGETDDFAHDGDYDHYLYSAQRDDAFIGKLWALLQSLPQYKNNTNLLITSDHGRGKTAADWQHHASKRAVEVYMKDLSETYPNGVEGSQSTWFAAMGPDIRSAGEIKPKNTIHLQQVTATALRTLGINPEDFSAAAAPAITEALK